MAGRVFTHCKAATLVAGATGYGLVEDAAIAVQEGRISWVGDASDLPQDYADWEKVELEGALVTPALVDCHTHLVFGGDRSANLHFVSRARAMKRSRRPVAASVLLFLRRGKQRMRTCLPALCAASTICSQTVSR